MQTTGEGKRLQEGCLARPRKMIQSKKRTRIATLKRHASGSEFEQTNQGNEKKHIMARDDQRKMSEEMISP